MWTEDNIKEARLLAVFYFSVTHILQSHYTADIRLIATAAKHLIYLRPEFNISHSHQPVCNTLTD